MYAEVIRERDKGDKYRTRYKRKGNAKEIFSETLTLRTR
jgi:hypothetical protein